MAYGTGPQQGGNKKKTSKKEDEKLFRKFQKWFRADRDFSKEWRKCAKEDFDFVAGEQWSEEDKARLKQLMRPIITMNRVMTVVHAVAGQEMGNKQEARFVPREMGDARANELLTEAGRWFRDQACADDVDSDAFMHSTICGMGWSDTTLDYTEEEDGEPKMHGCDPLKMFWDKNARAHNLTDRKRHWYLQQMTVAEAKEMFPDADITDLDAAWAKGEGDEGEIRNQDRDRLYQDDGYSETGDELALDEDRTITIVHCEYLENEKYYRVVDPMTGQKSEMDVADYKKYKKRAEEVGMPVHSTELTRKVVRQAFLGGKILQYDDGLGGPNFRYQCVTAFKNQNKGTFFGLVAQMKDPQRWANKWLSQALDILNSQSKGGIIVEESIVGENRRDFEDNFARPDKPLIVPEGALGQYPKIIPKPLAQFPQGFFQLMEFAISSVRDVVGVSIEMLGMREADQPARLEEGRKQAGMMILQPLFKNLKRYRHDHAKLMLYFIQNYLADGRLVKIVGQQGQQYVPLIKQADARYDIIIDDMPSAPNQKELVWKMIGDQFWKMPPEFQLAMLEFSPFPVAVIEAVRKQQQQKQQSPMAQLEQRMAQMEAALAEAKVGKTQAETQQIMHEMQQPPDQQMSAQQQMQIEQMKAQNQASIANQKLQGDQQRAQVKLAADQRLAQQKMQNDMALRGSQQQFDQQLRTAETIHRMNQPRPASNGRSN